MELIELFIGQAKKKSAFGNILTKQNKYVSQLKQEVVGALPTSFDPILERYIGKKVILELINGKDKNEYRGVLKDYTPEFLEILDIKYKTKEKQDFEFADIIVPRNLGVIRHLAE